MVLLCLAHQNQSQGLYYPVLTEFTMIIQPWPVDAQLSQYYPANTKQEYTLPPRVIYHYTSFETALLIIAGQTLRFSHPDTF